MLITTPLQTIIKSICIEVDKSTAMLGELETGQFFLFVQLRFVYCSVIKHRILSLHIFVALFKHCNLCVPLNKLGFLLGGVSVSTLGRTSLCLPFKCVVIKTEATASHTQIKGIFVVYNTPN